MNARKRRSVRSEHDREKKMEMNACRDAGIRMLLQNGHEEEASANT